METFGIGDSLAKFKYVASSISNHSWRQSVCVEAIVVATGHSFTKLQEFRLAQTSAGTTSNLGSESGLN